MQTDKWQIRLIQLLAIPGMLLAFYLLLYHNGEVFIACDSSGWDDCGQVSGPTARFSAIGPVPVALIGLLGYASFFLAPWLADIWQVLDDYLPEISVSLSGFAFLFTLGLTALEAFVLHTYCRYCLISAGLVTVIFALSLSYLRSVNRVAAQT